MKLKNVRLKTTGKDTVVTTDVNTFAVTIASEKDRKGICPAELLMSALGSCISLTVSAVAENKGIQLEKLEVKVEYDVINMRDYDTRFRVNIDFGRDLNEKEHKMLFGAARACNVSKILKGAIDVEYIVDSTSIAS